MRPFQRKGATGPLRGMTVLITRPFTQSEHLLADVKALGGAPKIAPVIDICFRDDAVVDAQVKALDTFDAAVVTSANALRALAAAAERLGQSLSGRGLKWFVISQQTAQTAREFGLQPVTFEGVRTGEEFARKLIEVYAELPPAKILVPRGQLGKQTILTALQSAGHNVVDCVCYDTVEHHLSRETWQGYLSAERIAILLFSPSAVHSLVKQLGPVPLKRRSIYKIAVGPTTAEACKTLGIEVSAVAQAPNAKSVLEALVGVSANS